MSEIWKFPLALMEFQQIFIPKGASILCAQVQENIIHLWAELDPDQEKANRTIAIIGTGNPLPANRQYYIGTVQTPPFVWHIYEVSP